MKGFSISLGIRRKAGRSNPLARFQRMLFPTEKEAVQGAKKMSESFNVTISGFERIAEEQRAKAERDVHAGCSDAADRLHGWKETLAIIDYMKKHGVPDSLKDRDSV